MRPFALLALVVLGGCSGHELAVPTGPLFALNPGQWQPAPAQLAAPPRREFASSSRSATP